MRTKSVLLLLSLIPCLLLPSAGQSPRGAGDTQQAIARGLRYLRGTQQKDGSWQHYPAITALAAMAFLRAGYTEKDAAVEKAVKFIISQAKKDGAIYSEGNPATALPNYNTALCMTALYETKNPKYADIVKKAQKYLEQAQFDEGEGFTRKDVKYGGMGYSSSGTADLSNLQTALEALRDTNFSKDSPLWDKAIVFLQRCQNRADSNDQKWAGNDGGFVYASTGESKAEGHTSYGSMTYAGLKSYIYCGVSKTDPRAQAAWHWLRAHYTVKENPGMKDAGLFYYYHTMAKTLNVFGERIVTDTAGKKHRWTEDLSRQLISAQAKDGSWSNKNARWWENKKDLVTAYAVLALVYCQKS